MAGMTETENVGVTLAETAANEASRSLSHNASLWGFQARLSADSCQL